MKYALNHSWRFRHAHLGFLVGLMQTVMIVTITLLNYFVIIVASNSILDVAKDFLAMMIITNFDDFFFEQHSDDNPLKNVV